MASLQKLAPYFFGQRPHCSVNWGVIIWFTLLQNRHHISAKCHCRHLPETTLQRTTYNFTILQFLISS
uniref:Uncharacterized protein n=1 Tax=Anguilla anguilla TaxID=7936 RepID=A0A0E9WM49_ANGAN